MRHPTEGARGEEFGGRGDFRPVFDQARGLVVVRERLPSLGQDKNCQAEANDRRAFGRAAMMMVGGDVDLDAVFDRKPEELDIGSTPGVIGDMDDLMAVHGSKRIQCPGEGGRQVLVELRLQAATWVSKATALRTAATGIS